IEELGLSNEGLRSKFKYLEEWVREREKETKAKQQTIKNLEEKVREESRAKQDIINNYEEKFKDREEVSKEKQIIINELEER
ncbi:14744_t:CDS:1, partial [Funneliformis geosporum]